MKTYFVTYLGEQPAELSEMTVYRPKLATGFVIVTTDKSVEELIGIKGVINVAKADTVNLLQAYKFCRNTESDMCKVTQAINIIDEFSRRPSSRTNQPNEVIAEKGGFK